MPWQTRYKSLSAHCLQSSRSTRYSVTCSAETELLNNNNQSLFQHCTRHLCGKCSYKLTAKLPVQYNPTTSASEGTYYNAQICPPVRPSAGNSTQNTRLISITFWFSLVCFKGFFTLRHKCVFTCPSSYGPLTHFNEITIMEILRVLPCLLSFTLSLLRLILFTDLKAYFVVSRQEFS